MPPITDPNATPPIISGITDKATYFAAYLLTYPKIVRDIVNQFIHDPNSMSAQQYVAAIDAIAINHPNILIDPALAFIQMETDIFDRIVVRLNSGQTTVHAWDGFSDAGGPLISMPPDLMPFVDPPQPENLWTMADPTGKDPSIGLWRDVAGYKALTPSVTVRGPRYLPTERGKTMSQNMAPVVEAAGDGFLYRCVNSQGAPDDPICLFERIG